MRCLFTHRCLFTNIFLPLFCFEDDTGRQLLLRFYFFLSLPLASDVGPVMSEVTEGKSPVPVLTEGRSPVPALTEGRSPVPSRAVEAIGYKLLSIYLFCPIIEASQKIL